MELKNIYRGDIIECRGYLGGKMRIHTEPSGRKCCRYGNSDRIISGNTVLINVGENKYISLSELSSHFGDISNATIITTFATGDGSYYVDETSLKKYEFSYIPEDNYKAYGDSDLYDSDLELSKK